MIDPLHSYDPFDILNLIYELIRYLITGQGSSFLSDYFLGFYGRYGYFLILSSLFLSSVLVIFIAYVIFRVHGVYSKQRKSLKPVQSTEEEKEEAVKNEKWKIIAEMLDKSGYRGEGIGEQLKSADKSDFTTIDDAWEAHKIRNSIAHEGASFMITEREAKRVIGLYKKVFEEFDYI